MGSLIQGSFEYVGLSGVGSEAVAATTIEYSSAPFFPSWLTISAPMERFWPIAT